MTAISPFFTSTTGAEHSSFSKHVWIAFAKLHIEVMENLKGVTPQQMRWAARHDWYENAEILANGNYLIYVRDDMKENSTLIFSDIDSMTPNFLKSSLNACFSAISSIFIETSKLITFVSGINFWISADNKPGPAPKSTINGLLGD